MAAHLITVSPMMHENQERIRVNLPYDPALIQKIRTVSGARWSPKKRCWHVPKTPGAWACLKAFFGEIQIVPAPAPEPPPDAPPLSPPPKMPASPLAERYAPDKITHYILGLIREKKISESHQSQILSAIKMFYASVIQQEHKVQGLFLPKRPEKLPHVLQELLGHESSKTTEIYTHITRKGMDKIRSPLDDLDL